jgi:predicted transcriptional regulator
MQCYDALKHWKTETCAQILKTSLNDTTIDDIVSNFSSSDTSSAIIHDCLDALSELKLIEYDLTKKKYRATERGKKFAMTFLELAEEMKMEEQRYGPFHSEA